MQYILQIFQRKIDKMCAISLLNLRDIYVELESIQKKFVTEFIRPCVSLPPS